MIVHFKDYGTIAQSVEQQTFNLLVQGSNPCGPTNFLPLAQLDRASGFYPLGREFESLRAGQIL